MEEIEKGIFKEKNSDNRFILNISKKYFEQEPIMQAIHEYTNNFTVTMEPKGDDLVAIFFTAKDNNKPNIDLIKSFTGRVIDYQIRRDLEKEYGHIRDTIIDYAYSPIKKN